MQFCGELITPNFRQEEQDFKAIEKITNAFKINTSLVQELKYEH